MAIKEAMLPEFDHEMATTRLLLERAPEDAADWKPHERSMSLGQLAIHLAQLPLWAESTLSSDAFDTEVDGADLPRPDFESREQLLALFDRNVANARAAIAGTEDGTFMLPWSLKKAGQIVFTLPRAAVLRTFVLNHLIHHRGQLSVYLRLRDVPLPSIYGPTADTP